MAERKKRVSLTDRDRDRDLDREAYDFPDVTSGKKPESVFFRC